MPARLSARKSTSRSITICPSIAMSPIARHAKDVHPAAFDASAGTLARPRPQLGEHDPEGEVAQNVRRIRAGPYQRRDIQSRFVVPFHPNFIAMTPANSKAGAAKKLSWLPLTSWLSSFRPAQAITATVRAHDGSRGTSGTSGKPRTCPLKGCRFEVGSGRRKYKTPGQRCDQGFGALGRIRTCDPSLRSSPKDRS
jgi:hypothetical protein